MEKEAIAYLKQVEFYIATRNDSNFLIVKGNARPQSPININFLADKRVEFISRSQPELLISIATGPISPFQPESTPIYRLHL